MARSGNKVKENLSADKKGRRKSKANVMYTTSAHKKEKEIDYMALMSLHHQVSGKKKFE